MADNRSLEQLLTLLRTTATNPEYTDVVHEISQMLFHKHWEQEPDLDKK